jgi:DNA-binding transcriptional ArsR family regulator
MRLREIAVLVGVTERAVQRIIAELEEAGVITRLRKGRRNHYEIHPELPLRHSVEAHCTVGDLMRMLAVGEPASAIVSTADRD